MPRYDDKYSATRLYVGHLSSRTRSRDLEYIFSKYGRVRDVDMKRDYAFIDFSDPRDADDAIYYLDGKDVDGSRIVVEFARGVPRPSGSREYLGRGPTPGTGRCFNCGLDGHWARDCRAGDWKNKCYRCGERGHIERNCKNSPKALKRGRSYSRSRSRTPRRGRSPSPSHGRGRSYSRSRSPPPKRGRIVETNRRSLSPSRRSRSPTPDEASPHRSPSNSPRGRSRSRSPAENRSPVDDRSPMQANGRSYSPSPRNDRRSPMNSDDYEDNRRRSPRASESP